MMYSVLAYTLMRAMQRRALTNTPLAKAAPNRMRLTLLKIGAAVTRNTRTIRFMMNSAYPHQALYRSVARQLTLS